MITASILSELFSVESNTPLGDGLLCHKCNQTIEHVEKMTGRGIVTDRSNRIDCETKSGKLLTYHKKCWWELVYVK